MTPGPDVFYNGPIAAATIKTLNATNGTMSLQDLRNYTVAIRKPASIGYRDFKITSTSAPSSGIVVASVMKM
jgi:gamma-glutamyltranspeptidase/glutathione hydrolase